MENLIDDEILVLNQKIENIEDKCNKSLQEKLNELIDMHLTIPDLVGSDCRFPTLALFM